jgi:hypothetical protein
VSNFKNKHIRDNSLISGIGGVFRKAGVTNWGISVDFRPEQTKKSVSFSHAPILARYRYYNETKLHKPKGKNLTFTIEPGNSLHSIRFDQYPKWKQFSHYDTEQWYVTFELSSGKKVFIPQFELARALFFHDQYLAQMSLKHNALAEGFDIVNQNNDRALVNVLPTASYPLRYYTEPGNRRVLSWLLLDVNARKSFESIYRYLLQEMKANNKGNYLFWDFRFTPPDLSGACLAARGWDDWESNSFLVWEIKSVKNIPSEVPTDIDIFHPKYRRSTSNRNGGGFASKPQGNEEYIEDEEQTRDQDKSSVQLASSRTEFSFARPFKVNRSGGIQKGSKLGSVDNDRSLPCHVSSNDAGINGQLPGGDFNNLDDHTDDAELYLSKFRCFELMVRCLIQKHDCILISNQIRKLPALARCSKHLLSTDGNPRCMFIIELKIKNKIYYIMEVDVSDAEKPLSTKVINAKSEFTSNIHIEQIEKRLVKNSLRWPKNLFDKLYGEDGHYSIPHPKSSHNNGFLDYRDIEHWAERFYTWL